MTDFTKTRAAFHVPDGVIYLDGNSLGPMPVAAASRVAQTLQGEWAEMLIGGWNKAGWLAQPTLLSDRIGNLIGAGAGTVMLGQTLSIQVFQALAAALSLRPERRVILSDSGNFPSDLYIANGLIDSLGQGHELRLVAPEDIAGAIDEDVAVLMLTEVDYRTGRLHNMKDLTAKAHKAGALTLWDLAHSAGALPVDVTGTSADFATGCTYKYLNAGPGAPAFIYVAPCHIDEIRPALSGWLGHAAPFDFAPVFEPANGIERMRIGTPPVLAMAALEAALDIWADVSMRDVRAASISLSERFIAGVGKHCPELELASPKDPLARGSQVSFRFENGYAVIQALISRGVIGDFRAPDIMRFGITPLYLNENDIDRAVAILADILKSRAWDDVAFKTRSTVT